MKQVSNLCDTKRVFSFYWLWKLLINWKLTWVLTVVLLVSLILRMTSPHYDLINTSPVRKILDTSSVQSNLLIKTQPINNYDFTNNRAINSEEDRHLKEVEESFHELPAQQVDGNEVTSRQNNWRNLSENDISKLSVLGRRLFLDEDVGKPAHHNFTIGVWKYGPSIERRFMKSYGKIKKDPFEKCSVKNCLITYKDEELSDADAILFHLHRLKGPPVELKRNRSDQFWVWLTDENPHHTFLVAKDKNFSRFDGFFNWSMHYRMYADVPVPYGRTVPLKMQSDVDLQEILNSKNSSVAVMASNCGGTNKRFQYVRELKKYLSVDFYGGCGTLKCPGHFTKDCPILTNYLFYLAFENGNCEQYISEKVFWNALHKNAVPIVMGPPREQYEQLLPPNSFLHVDDYKCIKDLADHVQYLLNNKREYLKYHEWRKTYKIVNEHGYFGTDNFHYCRLCEALNYNSREVKIYNDLNNYWNKHMQCYLPTWIDKETNCK